MKRAALLFVAFASALACGAWRAHARAAAPTSSTEASAVPRFPPVPSPTSSRKIDEYGNISWVDERARLDNLAIEMRNDPTAIAYLVCYDGRRARAGEARRRCTRAARYLARVAALTAGRAVTLYGGFREDLTVELWALPVNSRQPALSPTVDPSEVTFVGDARRRKRPSRARRHRLKKQGRAQTPPPPTHGRT